MNIKYKFDDFEFDLLNPLGIGKFGNVYKATEKNSGKFMQLKEFQFIFIMKK